MPDETDHFPTSYRHSWDNLKAFASYGERRELVAEAFGSQICRMLADNFEPGAVLVEIGSGDGAMRAYAGDKVASSYRWVETEQSHLFLTKSRTPNIPKVQATSAQLPFDRDSIDGAIGLSMFDVLSSDDLEATVQSIGEVLIPGGKVAHLLDMSPDYMAEIENAKARGEFPVPYDQDGKGPMGLAYIRLKNKHIFAKIRDMQEPQSIRNTLCNLIEFPEQVTQLANRTNVLPYLGSLLVKHSLAYRVVPDWLQHFGERLEETFTAYGLTVITNGVVKTSAIQDRRKLPPRYRRYNHIIRRQGVVTLMEGGIKIPDKVTVEADAHLFVAQKTIHS